MMDNFFSKFVCGNGECCKYLEKCVFALVGGIFGELFCMKMQLGVA